MSKLDVDDSPVAPGNFKVGEKGFGVCSSCGKHTMGRTNPLCSRCGGTALHLLLGTAQHDLPHLRFGTIETTYVVDGARRSRTGYPARAYRYVMAKKDRT